MSEHFDAVVVELRDGPVQIQRNGQQSAVLISAKDYEEIHQLRARELIRMSDETSRYAESTGMTEELLEQLMADEP